MEIASSASLKAKRDYELICKARENGDQKAYTELMELYREQIYYMLYLAKRFRTKRITKNSNCHIF